jgi:hypothetical protein
VQNIEARRLSLASRAVNECANLPCVESGAQRSGEILDARRRRLAVRTRDRHRSITIDDESRHAVALTVQEAVRVAANALKKACAQCSCAQGALLKEGFVDGVPPPSP